MTDREKILHERDHQVADADWCDNDWKDNVPIWMLRGALALLKEQETKPPIHVHEEYPEHDWETDEDGKIDEWAMSYEFHNGPMCKRCYHSFCIHCEPNGFNDGPCVIDKYKCPNCGCVLQKGTKFCSECGQAVKWDG